MTLPAGAIDSATDHPRHRGRRISRQGGDRWQYIPFSAGPRTCIGDHFAMLEATLALATISRRAEIRSLSDDFPVALPVTLVAAAPVLAEVHPRTPDD